MVFILPPRVFEHSYYIQPWSGWPFYICLFIYVCIYLHTHTHTLSLPLSLSLSLSSAGKESACNVGDPSSIPGSGRAPEEGMGYPLQYSWVSLVAQMVKNLPTMLETWVRSLGWEDPLEEGMATYSHILAWRIPMDREVWWATVFGISESDTKERLSTAHVYFYFHHIVFDYCWDGGDFL